MKKFEELKKLKGEHINPFLKQPAKPEVIPRRRNRFDRYRDRTGELKRSDFDSAQEYTTALETKYGLNKPVNVSPKLEVSKSTDPSELEADAIAEKITNMSEADIIQNSSSGIDMVQAKAGSEGITVSPGMESEINNISGGQPLSETEKLYFGQRFGVDFGNISIHDDEKAHQLADNLDACAFTAGNNIVFGRGERTHDKKGIRLMAHELTHVVQNGYRWARSKIKRQTANTRLNNHISQMRFYANRLLSQNASNQSEYAAWILLAARYGFATLRYSARPNLLAIKNRRYIRSINTASTSLPIVETMYHLARTRINRWIVTNYARNINSMSVPPSITFGSFMTSNGLLRRWDSGVINSHGLGEAIDINDLGFHIPNNPYVDSRHPHIGIENVIEILNDLPPGRYGLGMPCQGHFFPNDSLLSVKTSGLLRNENMGQDVTGLVVGWTHIYKQRWNNRTNTWDNPVLLHERQAETMIISDELKRVIIRLRNRGYHFIIYPDRDNHLHLHNRINKSEE